MLGFLVSEESRSTTGPTAKQEEEHDASILHPSTHLNGARIFAYHIRTQHFKKTGGHQGLIGTAAVHYIWNKLVLSRR